MNNLSYSRTSTGTENNVRVHINIRVLQAIGITNYIYILTADGYFVSGNNVNNCGMRECCIL